MEISRRGFLKLLAAIPAAVIATKAEALVPIVPLVHEERFTEEEKDLFWTGQEDYEIRFDELSIGAHSLCTRHETPQPSYSWYPSVPPVMPVCRNTELSFSSYFTKNMYKAHSFFTEWVDPMMRKPVPMRRASLIRHTKAESFVIAEFDVLYPKHTQATFLTEQSAVLEVTLAIDNVKIYQENLEKCQIIMG